MADKEIESFDRQVDNSSRLLIEEVKTTFYDLLLAEKKVELAERSIALNSQLLDITKQRFDAGDVPELEVNLARVEVARSEGQKGRGGARALPGQNEALNPHGASSG